MITIQTVTDLKALETKRMPTQLVQFIADLFLGHNEELGGDQQLLSENPIYVYEPDDSLLHMLSLTPLGPEYIERIEVPGLPLYRVGIMLDNESIAQYLIPAGTLDEESERWLEENVVYGGVKR